MRTIRNEMNALKGGRKREKKAAVIEVEFREIDCCFVWQRNAVSFSPKQFQTHHFVATLKLSALPLLFPLPFNWINKI